MIPDVNPLDVFAQFVVFTLSATSGSMEPAMMEGDTYTVDTTIELDQLKKGDIIIFARPDGDYGGVTHRIVDIEHGGGGGGGGDDDKLVTKIITQGDANDDVIEGIDLTEDLNREELLFLYVGKVTPGEPTPEHQQKLLHVTHPFFS